MQNITYHITSHHSTSHHIITQYIVSHHITLHHITYHKSPINITSHHITSSYHIASHRTTLHRITCLRFVVMGAWDTSKTRLPLTGRSCGDAAVGGSGEEAHGSPQVSSALGSKCDPREVLGSNCAPRGNGGVGGGLRRGGAGGCWEVGGRCSTSELLPSSSRI